MNNDLKVDIVIVAYRKILLTVVEPALFSPSVFEILQTLCYDIQGWTNLMFVRYNLRALNCATFLIKTPVGNIDC